MLNLEVGLNEKVNRTFQKEMLEAKDYSSKQRLSLSLGI